MVGHCKAEIWGLLMTVKQTIPPSVWRDFQELLLQVKQVILGAHSSAGLQFAGQFLRIPVICLRRFCFMTFIQYPDCMCCLSGIRRNWTYEDYIIVISQCLLHFMDERIRKLVEMDVPVSIIVDISWQKQVYFFLAKY